MMGKKVPLTYNGVTVGEAEVEFDEKGSNIKAHIFHPDIANKILGPSLEAVSYGSDYSSLEFSGVIPNVQETTPAGPKRGKLLVMMDRQSAINSCREVLNDYEASRERSLAITKLDEFEMWLQRCKPTQEAIDRDRSSKR
jgi:hypothetical protein